MIERLVVHRLRVKFHVPTTPTFTEVVSLQDGYTDDEIRAACAGSRGWPFDSAQYILLDDVEVVETETEEWAK